MKECPNCAVDIPDGKAVCPVCKYEFPSRGPFPWKVTAVVVLAALLVPLVWTVLRNLR